ncbi:hypothetical protein LTR33_001121 [Friedmanniomyces endolithicus]|nr:hypothetical protein LTR33_001121 [Friedmanniomyces endolithicus]
MHTEWFEVEEKQAMAVMDNLPVLLLWFRLQTSKFITAMLGGLAHGLALPQIVPQIAPLKLATICLHFVLEQLMHRCCETAYDYETIK